jgi:tetratricopeptide (TPR) repeat protein
VKIISEPAPPLSTYIEGYYPPELDEIIKRGLAKDRDARYATADQFAFDLEHVEGLLKSQVVADYVENARIAMESDLPLAQELLALALKADTQNFTAKQMLYQVQQLMHQQQRSGQAEVLREKAEDALSKKNWTEALTLVDQALKVDPTSSSLERLRETVLQRKARKEQVLKLVHLAEQAQRVGEYKMARRAADDALTLDPDDTQAKLLIATLAKEIENHQQFEELLLAVRNEVTAARFEDAARLLREAEALCPQASEIPPLKNLIASGREEQLRRERFENFKREAEQLMERSLFPQAQTKAEQALNIDPTNKSVLDLLKRIKSVQYEQWIAEQIALADKLVLDGHGTDALKVIEKALTQFDDKRLKVKLPELRVRHQEQQRSAGIAAALASAVSASLRHDHTGVIAILEKATATFGTDPEIEKFLATTYSAAVDADQRKQVTETLQNARRLRDGGNATAAETLLVKAIASGLKHDDIDRQLADVRAAVTIEQATRLMEERSGPTSVSADTKEPDSAETGPVNERPSNKDRRKINTVYKKVRTLRAAGDLVGAIACFETLPLNMMDGGVKRLLAEVKAELEAQNGATVGTQVEPVAQLIENDCAEEMTSDRSAAPIENKPAIVTPAPIKQTSSIPEPAESRIENLSATQIFTEVPAPVVKVNPVPATEEQPKKIEIVTTVATAPSPSPAKVTPVSDPVVDVPPVSDTTVSRKTKLFLPKMPQFKPWMGIAAIAALFLMITLAVVVRPKATVAVSFETDPAGAEVSAQGFSCQAPCTLKLKPGTRDVKASIDGYTPSETQIVVGKTPQTIAINLEAIQVALGSVRVQTNTDGVDLLVDGTLKGVSTGKSTTLSLVPGRHQIRAEKSGYDSAEQSIEVGSRVANVQLSLKQASGQQQPARDPYLIIHAKAGAHIQIDGGRSASAPADGTYSVQLKAGKHRVSVSMNGYETWSDTVATKPGDSVPLSVNLKEKARPVIAVSQPVPTPVIPIRVPVLAPPTISLFESGTENLTAGQSVKLAWATQYASEVSIEPGIGNVEGSGSREVRPSKTTVYSLTAKGQGGSTSKSVQVVVVAAPAPTPAPTPAPAVTTAVKFDADVKGVHDAIEVRYKEAYESMDISELQKAWPTMTKPQRDAINNSFKAYKALKIKYSCSQPSISGDSAHCACTESVTYTTNDNKRQSPISASFGFDLKRSGGIWYVQGRRVQ